MVALALALNTTPAAIRALSDRELATALAVLEERHGG